MEIEIIPVKGHFEIYINKEFYCSADSWHEAVQDVENYRKANQI